MRTIQEYQRMGGVPAMVEAVSVDAKADRDAEWGAIVDKYEQKAARATLAAERWAAKVEALEKEAYDRGFSAGKATAGQPPRRRVVERDSAGQIVAIVG